MLLSTKGPLGFCCGVFVSLILFYLWRVSFLSFDLVPSFKDNSVPQTTAVHGSDQSLWTNSNQTATEPAAERYSIQDAVSNSTLGVSWVAVAEM